MARQIIASVGVNGSNRDPDVRTVQELLNKVPPDSGGPVPLLKVDGLGWQKTQSAIKNFQKRHLNFQWPDGRVDPMGKTLAALNTFDQPPGDPSIFIVHDVRLFGWKPIGDVLEVNVDTPLQWLIDNVVSRGTGSGGNQILKIMSHGLPGFVQCARGAFQHPTLPTSITDPAKGDLYIGPGKGGMSAYDLDALSQLNGKVKRIEFHSCLVARIGTCFEANGHTCYDGNAFCFQLAQRTAAEVRASIHLQWYWCGSGPNNGMHFGTWNGLVFTWGPAGNIIESKPYPYTDVDGPPPPGAEPT
ncbi:MAG: peptidoglycan-binding protein [Pyrinomonadaceae bacterium]